MWCLIRLSKHAIRESIWSKMRAKEAVNDESNGLRSRERKGEEEGEGSTEGGGTKEEGIYGGGTKDEGSVAGTKEGPAEAEAIA